VNPLYHRLEGAGEPTIVLLNGGMMTTVHWEPIASLLVERRHRVLRLDLRGQLMSPGAAAQDFVDHADDVAALLDRLDIPPAVVVGTSFGALVGLVLAAEHPERVASLVVMNATARLSPEMLAATRLLRRYAEEAAAGTGDPGRILDVLVPGTYSDAWIAGTRDVIAQRRGQMSALPATYYQGMADLLRVLEGLDLAPVLGRIRVPVHVVAAELDKTFPVECSRELAAHIAGAHLTVVPGAPHGFVIEQPPEAVRLILAAADAVRGEGAA